MINAEGTVGQQVMEQVDIDKLVQRCLELLENSNLQNNEYSSCRSFNCYDQVFIGIAGTPGSGKSYLAEQVRDRINERNPNGDKDSQEAVVIPMDGYHLSRAQLKELADKKTVFTSDQFTDDGSITSKILSYDELMARRGSAFTFCPSSFIKDLRKVKDAGEGSFPVYDRSKHDPVPNGVSVKKANKVVLVEGLYLLALDDPEWEGLDELWDDKWFVDVSMEETKRRLINRHLKSWDADKTKIWGGTGREAAARKAEENDLKNARCITKNSKHHAKLIIVNENIPE